MVASPTPLVAFVARSGTGKTTLLEKLLPELRRHGLRIAAIKHTHHDFDIDQPGKDSYRMRSAGARQVMIASRQRWALLTEHERQAEPDLAELLRHLDHDHLDLILVEGFKHEAVPKIELHRADSTEPLLCAVDRHIIAVASDTPLAIDIPQLDLNDVAQIAAFVMERILGRNG